MVKALSPISTAVIGKEGRAKMLSNLGQWQQHNGKTFTLLSKGQGFESSVIFLNVILPGVLQLSVISLNGILPKVILPNVFFQVSFC